jgi:hypothetical protein
MLHVEERNGSRKLKNCSMWTYTWWILVLDTSDLLRSVNIQSMFEAAGKDVGSGSASPRRGQLKWRTLILKIGKKLKAEIERIENS